MSFPHAAASNHARPVAKRRKVRKGTFSCWECKRRKMRCIFDPEASGTCNGCRRRGSQCVSQEFPEEISLSVDQTHDIAESAARTEHPDADSESTVHTGRTDTTSNEDSRKASNGIPTPLSRDAESPRHLAFYKFLQHRSVRNAILQSATNTPAPSRYEILSEFLHESLPSREDMQNILAAKHNTSVLGHEMLTMPYATLEQSGLRTPESLLDIPGPTQHPILIARYMLLLATFLQHLQPNLRQEIEGLAESPRTIMDRLVDFAVGLVTTNDEMLDSIEGLECVMIESVYQMNIGNLRRSWVAIRRAMSIAQLMGLHRPDNRLQYKVLDGAETQCNPQVMWFRIVDIDRYLCLMLSLPQGSLDRTMASDAMFANDTTMGSLERIHCVIASRILERNHSFSSSNDYALTRIMDVELQVAARSLPGKWWLAPNFVTASSDPQALFWQTRRLYAQVIHYNILNQLHLPYMLHSSSADRKYEYSRITCVNASREVLSRFITVRSYDQIAYSCRTLDFVTLMAAMTLLLAHLTSQHADAENFLAHQYHSDRAMIEQVQESMTELSRLNADALSAQSAELLRRLLSLDGETVDGSPCGAGGGRVSVQLAGSETSQPVQDDNAGVSVHIPYFGVIKIARRDMSKDAHGPQPDDATTNSQAQDVALSQTVNNSSTANTHLFNAEPPTRCFWFAEPRQALAAKARILTDAGYGQIEDGSMTSKGVSDAFADSQAQPETSSSLMSGMNEVNTHLTSPMHDTLISPLLQQGEYPSLTASGEDWALQGVDMAFFENLTRSAGNDATV